MNQSDTKPTAQTAHRERIMSTELTIADPVDPIIVFLELEASGCLLAAEEILQLEFVLIRLVLRDIVLLVRHAIDIHHSNDLTQQVPIGVYWISK